MERHEDRSVIPMTAPVFVDDSGRRGALARRAARILVAGFAGYLGLLGTGFTRDPRLGSVHLPTFDLPGLGVAAPPAPSVLGEQTTRAASATEVAAGAADGTTGATKASPTGGQRAGTAPARPGLPVPAPTPGGGASSATNTPVGTAGALVTPPAAGPPTTNAPTAPGHGSKGSTTTSTTTSSTTTTSTTTTTTAPPAQSSGTASGKGPDGSGPPGQARRATTPKAEPPTGG
ncbi:MAG: hypothetical protein QOE13_3143 [Gaiellaceae bacterium]|jgi:hypothetical protein|nr:hypothetical protein [Gaiellaceae bacterium]